MIIKASFKTNIATKNYKTREFACELENKYPDGLEDKEIEQIHEALHILCVKCVRKEVKEYIKSMKHPVLLQGGTKAQYTRMEGKRFKND